MTPVSNALKDTSSIAKASAVRFKELANSSIVNKEFVKNAIKDIQWSMANVKVSTPSSLTTSDAQSGATELALNAPRDGTSPTMSVYLLVIFAPPGMKPLESAIPATTDTSLSKENVLSTTTLVLSLTATFSARPGLDLPVSNAPTELFSMLTESAPQ